MASERIRLWKDEAALDQHIAAQSLKGDVRKTEIETVSGWLESDHVHVGMSDKDAVRLQRVRAAQDKPLMQAVRVRVLEVRIDAGAQTQSFAAAIAV